MINKLLTLQGVESLSKQTQKSINGGIDIQPCSPPKFPDFCSTDADCCDSAPDCVRGVCGFWIP